MWEPEIDKSGFLRYFDVCIKMHEGQIGIPNNNIPIPSFFAPYFSIAKVPSCVLDT